LLYGHAYQKKIGSVAASARRLFGAPVVPREGKQGASHGNEQQAPEQGAIVIIGGVIRLSLTGAIVCGPMTLIAAFAALFALGLLSLAFMLPSEF
jgi:hypothetical protein